MQRRLQRLQDKLRWSGHLEFRVASFALPSGAVIEREYFEHPGGVTVVALTPRQELVLVRQYRFTLDQCTLEFPGGTLEPGEAPEVAAKRELLEESGYESNDWTLLGEFFLAPGYSTEVQHVYLARDSQPAVQKVATDDDEWITEVLCWSIEQWQAFLKSPSQTDAKTLAAWQLAKLQLAE
jgi:ADP-ribose pyrophosphatase